jgi:hypothetical protein
MGSGPNFAHGKISGPDPNFFTARGGALRHHGRSFISMERAQMTIERAVTGALVSAMLALAAAAAGAADVRVGVSVSGEIAPGVYGRVDITNRPAPPPLVYPQPVIIVRQPHAAVMSPIYMHVPPGHAKDWSKHCRRYNACNQPVYFVKSAEYEPGYKHPGKGHGKSRSKGKGD